MVETIAPSAKPDVRPQSRCFACGPEHPHGLHLEFAPAVAGGVGAEWVPQSDWEGWEGIIHGGIVSTVLDEAMAKAVAATSCDALTAELRVRLRHHVAPGERLRVRGWVGTQRKRLIEAEASLTDLDGNERAHAWASFVLVKTQVQS